MKRWIRMAAALYPGSWRERYGAGFDALLEDAGSGWRDLFDVFRGAIKMQMVSWNFRMMAACGLAGALLAGAIAFRMPPRYVSTALFRITLQSGATLSDRLAPIAQQVFSRASLGGLIMKRNLYQRERQSKPMSHIVEQMRQNIVIKIVKAAGAQPAFFEVSFADEDPKEARSVNQDLARMMIDQNLIMRMNESGSAPPGSRQEASQGSRMELLDPPNLPRKPARPNHLAWITLGAGGGLLLAAVIALARRSPGLAASAPR
jgi:hypothetical protein